ncbi:MAG: ribosomal protein L7/L12 [Myxococcales bacterium]|nr:ribosomal protein L7/L12 [Myxococcales bacterium]
MSLTRKQVIDYIKSLPVSELVLLMEELQEELGVELPNMYRESVVMGVGPTMGMAYDSCSLFLEGYPEDKKILVIKTYRTLTSSTLKEAKELVESAPCLLFEDLDRETAEERRRLLEESGARVRLE